MLFTYKNSIFSDYTRKNFFCSQKSEMVGDGGAGTSPAALPIRPCIYKARAGGLETQIPLFKYTFFVLQYHFTLEIVGVLFLLKVHRYTNADLKIWHYFCLHMKIICRRFHIKTSFTFWDMRTWVMWKVGLQTYRNNRTC